VKDSCKQQQILTNDCWQTKKCADMLHSKPVLEPLATTYRMPQQTKSELKKRIGN